MSEPTRQEAEEALKWPVFDNPQVGWPKDRMDAWNKARRTERAAARAWVDQEITDEMVERAYKAAAAVRTDPTSHSANWLALQVRAALQAALGRSDK